MMRFICVATSLLFLAVSGFGLDLAAVGARMGIAVRQIEITAELPHDTASFTQGLELYDGVLYESTGLYGQSSLRALDPKSGVVLRTVALPAGFFAEGLTVMNDRLIQLTWQEHTAFLYDLKTLERSGMWAYSEDGWGLTHDGASFIMSDGTTNLLFRAASDFTLTRIQPVQFGQGRLNNLNELEYANGRVYANVLGVDCLLEIDPQSGETTAVIDCARLRAAVPGDAEQLPLNGIAIDRATGEFLLTGKHWPTLFRVRLSP
ncbi:glutaminyl-peptide cyclotransferase [candidate division KSB1 bacterium]|nr:glutaminyl-peptide cyclotransferase [candidate division KSB1 bacterium]